MSLDVAMGGSTNTVLHLLAAAHEAGVDFTMKDIDRISRRVPCLCKVAPAIADVHVEDVHRAGGIMSILGELDRAGLHQPRRADRAQQEHGGGLVALGHHAQRRTMRCSAVFRAAPGGVPTQVAFSVRTGAGTSSTWIARTASSATRPMPSARTVAWPCSTATSPRRAAS
jgi:dihydroxy-acid dehydratase